MFAKNTLLVFLLCLSSATVFSEGMSSRSVGNNSKYPSNVVQTPDGFAQVKGFSNAAQGTLCVAIGYTDDQAGASSCRLQLADTDTNCTAAYMKTCANLTKIEYTAVKNLQSQSLNVSAASSTINTGQTTTLTTTGNQSTVTYTASGPCTVSGSTVTATNSSGTCTITANSAAALPTYKAASPTNIAITVAGRLSQPLTVSAASTAIYKGSGTTTITVTGKQTTPLTYKASGACTISG